MLRHGESAVTRSRVRMRAVRPAHRSGRESAETRWLAVRIIRSPSNRFRARVIRASMSRSALRRCRSAKIPSSVKVDGPGITGPFIFRATPVARLRSTHSPETIVPRIAHFRDPQALAFARAAPGPLKMQGGLHGGRSKNHQRLEF